MLSPEEVLIEAYKQFGRQPVCVDKLDKAVEQDTLQKAVDILIEDTISWEGRQNGKEGKT